MKTDSLVWFWRAKNVWVAWIRDPARIIHHSYHPTPDSALMHVWSKETV